MRTEVKERRKEFKEKDRYILREDRKRPDQNGAEGSRESGDDRKDQ